MKAIIVTNEAEGTAGMKLSERPDPAPAMNEVVVQVYASGFTHDELTWPSTWTDRHDVNRTPSIPGHELSGVVTGLGYGTTGLSIGNGYLALPIGTEMAHWLSISRSRHGILRRYRMM